MQRSPYRSRSLWPIILMAYLAISAWVIPALLSCYRQTGSLTWRDVVRVLSPVVLKQ